MDFWDEIDAKLQELNFAHSADDVINMLGSPSAGDAFFAGGGGDGNVCESLRTAGWSWVWFEADYHWCMEAPDGTFITYVEGDIYRGNSKVR